MCPTLKTSSGIITHSMVKGLWHCNVLILWQSVDAYPPQSTPISLPWYRGTGVPSDILKRCAEILEKTKDGKPIERLGSKRTAAMDQIYKVLLLPCHIFLHRVQGLKSSPRSSFIYSKCTNSFQNELWIPLLNMTYCGGLKTNFDSEGDSLRPETDRKLECKGHSLCHCLNIGIAIQMTWEINLMSYPRLTISEHSA